MPETLLERAIEARAALFDVQHEAALRLFNGFTEGCPQLVVDLYAATAVIHNYAALPAEGEPAAQAAVEVLRRRLPWVKAVVLKIRNGVDAAAKRGRLVFGTEPDRRVREHGVWYAVDLLMNRDASLYLDTRNLRRWALEHLAGKRVLNTFAYTGSLGVAARAAGARRVVQLDLNRKFLNVAEASYTLNGFAVGRGDFIAGDFYPVVGRFKRAGERFDCVFLDPPFFSATAKGTVDLASDPARLINKVRPLIDDGGWLVAINNALYLGGREYLRVLEGLCADGYLEIETLLPVPEDFCGYAEHPAGGLPADPAPFNHPTKIAVLRVKRK
jgi:23S rRNA (cytosine1962-C5)-methyltransferase